MRISDWSSDVCSSDLFRTPLHLQGRPPQAPARLLPDRPAGLGLAHGRGPVRQPAGRDPATAGAGARVGGAAVRAQRPTPGADPRGRNPRSEEHTSELQSLMRISYAVFCLKKKKKIK